MAFGRLGALGGGFGRLGGGGKAVVPRNTLRANTGTFILTGNAANLNSYKLAASVGTFNLTGTDMTPKSAYVVPAALGTFALTGQDATLTAPSSSPVTLTYQSTTIGSHAGSVASFGTLTLGAAPSANRRVIVIFALTDLDSGNLKTISSGVFTPNSGGTINIDTSVIIGRSATEGHALVSAVLPLGTTSTLDLTISGSVFSDSRFSMYTVDNSTLLSPTSPVTGFNTNTAGTTLTTTVNTLAGGGLLALFGGNSSPGTFTSGITSSDGAFGNYIWGSISNTSASTPFSVTDTWVGTNNPASLALAAYR